MAPRSRLLDLETQDVLFFYGDLVGVATHAIVFWPVLLAAALLFHLIAPLDCPQQLPVAHLQNGLICRRREENPVLQKRRSPAVFPFPSRKGEAVALPRALGSSGRWPEGSSGRWPEAEERGEDGRTLPAWSGCRRESPLPLCLAGTRVAEELPSRPSSRRKGRAASCVGPCSASSVLRGWAEEGGRASCLHWRRRCSSPSAPPRAVGGRARFELPPVGSAPGPRGAAAGGLRSASSARPPPVASSRTASRRRASRPLSCADPGRQDLRDAMELLHVVPCAAPRSSSAPSPASRRPLRCAAGRRRSTTPARPQLHPPRRCDLLFPRGDGRRGRGQGGARRRTGRRRARRMSGRGGGVRPCGSARARRRRAACGRGRATVGRASLQRRERHPEFARVRGGYRILQQVLR